MICPVCKNEFKSLAGHFSALTWKPKGKNRKLRKDKIGIEHRKYLYQNYNKIYI